MLTSFNHEAHRGFANAIDADLLEFRNRSLGPLQGTPIGDLITGAQYPEYDYYILEGSPTLFSAAGINANRDGKVIYLAAERGMYALSSASPATNRNSIIGNFMEGAGGPVAKSIASRSIDGVIAVSDFVADYTRLFVGPNTPISVAHPYIQPGTYENLTNIEPHIESKTVVTIGRGMEYKNMNSLVEAWPTVKQAHPEAELKIIGKDHPKKYEKTNGVSVLGFVEDLNTVLTEASLFVQPSDGDAFPVSSLEAMRAGIPPLVTSTTGTRSEARAINKALVVDTDPNDLARGIIKYLNRPIEERRELSEIAEKRSEEFGPEAGLERFRESFESLLERIEA